MQYEEEKKIPKKCRNCVFLSDNVYCGFRKERFEAGDIPKCQVEKKEDLLPWIEIFGSKPKQFNTNH
jgi:hypothetical protein